MEFANESEFESYLRDLIKAQVCSKHDELVLFENKKAVDILICRNGDRPALFFLEVKFHKNSHGRLGFGSSSGGGFQPEIVSKAPDYFESNLMWLIAGEGHSDNGVIFVPSSIIRNYLSGGSVGEKFNNIQNRIFSEVTGYNEEDLVNKIESWLINT
ncbi:hypothetical protein tloyanaT_32180 [Thalassotalea loyana]|uniref:Restriction endonuclease type IV Mrr domain-containing protein n=1 Tax=Thalassotalea loyana TaxID=280483 RepID=A0ABQ6HJ22_9GAMM|nr:hypothetical protein [Thalassotalea loyana]GLX86965.1 hypothetical protein tloyanaT_32180 [Thalassotalea loyana]